MVPSKYPLGNAKNYLKWLLYIAYENRLLGSTFKYSDAYLAAAVLSEVDPFRFPPLFSKTFKKAFFSLVNEGYLTVVDKNPPRTYKFSDRLEQYATGLRNIYNLVFPRYDEKKLESARKNVLKKFSNARKKRKSRKKKK